MTSRNFRGLLVGQVARFRTLENTVDIVGDASVSGVGVEGFGSSVGSSAGGAVDQRATRSPRSRRDARVETA